MKQYFLTIACLFLLGFASMQAMFEFIDEATGDTLSINRGTKDDWKVAKEFCIGFFKHQYSQIPEEQREFQTIEELADQKFTDHFSRVFDTQEYTFFVVKKGDTFIGYTIFDVIGDYIYSIETQADIKTYSIKSLMKALAQFIKEQVAPEVHFFIAAARCAVSVYAQLLMMCDFKPVNFLHPSLANPADYYNDSTRPSVVQYYQGYEFKL